LAQVKLGKTVTLNSKRPKPVFCCHRAANIYLVQPHS
jgi:hypothetical protein